MLHRLLVHSRPVGLLLHLQLTNLEVPATVSTVAVGVGFELQDPPFVIRRRLGAKLPLREVVLLIELLNFPGKLQLPLLQLVPVMDVTRHAALITDGLTVINN